MLHSYTKIFAWTSKAGKQRLFLFSILGKYCKKIYLFKITQKGTSNNPLNREDNSGLNTHVRKLKVKGQQEAKSLLNYFLIIGFKPDKSVQGEQNPLDFPGQPTCNDYTQNKVILTPPRAALSG